MTQTYPAGLLGTYYSVGHAKRVYRSSAVTGVYSIPVDFQEQIELLKYALARTIDRHPTLCYGIIVENEKKPAHFLQLKSIKWEDLVEVKTLTSEVKDDSSLEYEVGRGHEVMFEKQHERPAWRLLVLRYENEPQRVDVICYIHHSIGDGTSGAAFHKTLAQYLQEGSSSKRGTQPAWPYVVPEAIGRPLPIEEAYQFPPEPATAPASKTAEASTFEPWTGKSPSLDPYRSLTLILTIPYTNVSSILKYCRQRNITLTGLLHGFTTIYLANAVPTAKGFLGVTPFSMRRFTNISNDEIVCHVAGISNNWTADLLSGIRSSEENSAEEERIIYDICSQFQTKVAVEIAAVPQLTIKDLYPAAVVSDLEKLLEQIFQKKRNSTYEISNVGVVKLVAAIDEKPAVQLEKLIFSQCGMVTGAAIGMSVVSIAGGPLCVCLSWQEVVLPEKLMEGLKSYLERRLLACV